MNLRSSNKQSVHKLCPDYYVSLTFLGDYLNQRYDCFLKWRAKAFENQTANSTKTKDCQTSKILQSTAPLKHEAYKVLKKVFCGRWGLTRGTTFVSLFNEDDKFSIESQNFILKHAIMSREIKDLGKQSQ